MRPRRPDARSLNVVPSRINDKRSVVRARVLRPRAGRAVAFPAGVQGGCVESVDDVAVYASHVPFV